MHISPRLAPAARTTPVATATRIAPTAFTQHVRTCLCCPVRFLATNPEQFGCSSHRGEAWRKNAKAQEAAAAEARRKEAEARDVLLAAEGRRDFQRLLEDRAFKAYLSGERAGTRQPGCRQVVIRVDGYTSITRYLTTAQLETVEANERAAAAALARLTTTATAASN